MMNVFEKSKDEHIVMKKRFHSKPVSNFQNEPFRECKNKVQMKEKHQQIIPNRRITLKRGILPHAVSTNILSKNKVPFLTHNPKMKKTKTSPDEQNEQCFQGYFNLKSSRDYMSLCSQNDSNLNENMNLSTISSEDNLFENVENKSPVLFKNSSGLNKLTLFDMNSQNDSFDPMSISSNGKKEETDHIQKRKQVNIYNGDESQQICIYKEMSEAINRVMITENQSYFGDFNCGSMMKITRKKLQKIHCRRSQTGQYFDDENSDNKNKNDKIYLRRADVSDDEEQCSSLASTVLIDSDTDRNEFSSNEFITPHNYKNKTKTNKPKSPSFHEKPIKRPKESKEKLMEARKDLKIDKCDVDQIETYLNDDFFNSPAHSSSNDFAGEFPRNRNKKKASTERKKSEYKNNIIKSFETSSLNKKDCKPEKFSINMFTDKKNSSAKMLLNPMEYLKNISKNDEKKPTTYTLNNVFDRNSYQNVNIRKDLLLSPTFKTEDDFRFLNSTNKNLISIETVNTRRKFIRAYLEESNNLVQPVVKSIDNVDTFYSRPNPAEIPEVKLYPRRMF